MKQQRWFGLGILVTFGLVSALLLTGWLGWGRRSWTMPPGMHSDDGNLWLGITPSGCGTAENRITIEQAKTKFENYLQDSRFQGLELAEVMEFEHNFYAEVIDSQTGAGVMELLADKSLGAVRPEMGPNMMWNSSGLGDGMMSRTTASTMNRLSEAEALQSARAWLAANQRELQADDHADPFSGYYTLHTFRDGQIEGLLSVHGETGQVWYHSWHGKYVGMLDLEPAGTDH